MRCCRLAVAPWRSLAQRALERRPGESSVRAARLRHRGGSWNERRERRQTLSTPGRCEEPSSDSTKREPVGARGRSVGALFSNIGERGRARMGKREWGSDPDVTEAKAAAKAAASARERVRVARTRRCNSYAVVRTVWRRCVGARCTLLHDRVRRRASRGPPKKNFTPKGENYREEKARTDARSVDGMKKKKRHCILCCCWVSAGRAPGERCRACTEALGHLRRPVSALTSPALSCPSLRLPSCM